MPAKIANAQLIHIVVAILRKVAHVEATEIVVLRETVVDAKKSQNVRREITALKFRSSLF